MNWKPIETAPRDGTRIRLKWQNSEDVGEWSVWQFPEEVWARFPEYTGMAGEWSTEFGNAADGEIEPTHWMEL